MNKKKTNDEKKLKEMYEKLISYEHMLHEQNQKRIKVGILCIYIIPALFLFLLFITGSSSSKIIFLVLWIASLFIIAVYLICVEYIDYNLQEKINEIQGNDESEIESLIDIDEVVEKIEARGGKH